MTEKNNLIILVFIGVRQQKVMMKKQRPVCTLNKKAQYKQSSKLLILILNPDWKVCVGWEFNPYRDFSTIAQAHKRDADPPCTLQTF